MTPLVIAIDGPSGSGKSSTSRLVAQRLDLAYLDTGSMYRALALDCLRRGIDDDEGIVEAAYGIGEEFVCDPHEFRAVVRGTDVTGELHSPKISGVVSRYASVRTARRVLSEQMRAIIDRLCRIVVEGRDITTVVAPDADVRVLLQADPAARIARRERELAGAADHDTITRQVVGRDRDDARSSQFETPAEGVTLIDSTHLTLEQVANAVITLVPEGLR